MSWKGIKGVTKIVGSGIGSGAKALGTGTLNIGKKVSNSILGTKMPMGGINPVTKRRFATGVTLGMAGLDSSMYVPKVDPAKDHSGKVWDSLNS